MSTRYTRIAILLHWVIALAIILQLASGLWMEDAIKDKQTQALAYKIYQWHKSLGLTVLLLSVVRLGWRLTHAAPALPSHMPRWERVAAHTSHVTFYVFMITIPLLGWAMVSSSPLGLPTVVFGLFEWPHIPWLAEAQHKQLYEGWFKAGHEYMALATLGLLCIHIGAALKHHFIDRDAVLARMVPFITPRRPS